MLLGVAELCRESSFDNTVTKDWQAPVIETNMNGLSSD